MSHIIINGPEAVLARHFRTPGWLDIEAPKQVADNQSLLDVGQILPDAAPRSVAERLRSLLFVPREPGSLRLEPALGGEDQRLAKVEW